MTEEININSYQIHIYKLKEEDGTGYIALVPELAGCMSDGETYEEALSNVQAAMIDWMDAALENKTPIPDPILFNINK
jgi:predicted RNase H-like HicB family nuclease